MRQGEARPDESRRGGMMLDEARRVELPAANGRQDGESSCMT